MAPSKVHIQIAAQIDGSSETELVALSLNEGDAHAPRCWKAG